MASDQYLQEDTEVWGSLLKIQQMETNSVHGVLPWSPVFVLFWLFVCFEAI